MGDGEVLASRLGVLASTPRNAATVKFEREFSWPTLPTSARGGTLAASATLNRPRQVRPDEKSQISRSSWRAYSVHCYGWTVTIDTLTNFGTKLNRRPDRAVLFAASGG
jgi:hypothetical protein